MSIYDTPEPNDSGQDADKYTDGLFADPKPERDPDADRDARIEAEWLQGHQDEAFNTAADAQMFDNMITMESVVRAENELVQTIGAHHSGLLDECKAAEPGSIVAGMARIKTLSDEILKGEA